MRSRRSLRARPQIQRRRGHHPQPRRSRRNGGRSLRAQADQHARNRQRKAEPAPQRGHGLHERQIPAPHQHQPRRTPPAGIRREAGHRLLRRGGYVQRGGHVGLRPPSDHHVLRHPQARRLRAAAPVPRHAACRDAQGRGPHHSRMGEEPIADRRQSRFRQPRQLCGGCPRQAQPVPQGTVPLRFGQDRAPAPALRLRRRTLHVGLSGGTGHSPVSRRRGPGRFRAGVAGHHRHQSVPERSGHGLQPSVPEPVYPHQLRQAAHDSRGQALRGRKNGRSRFRRSRRPNREARRRHRGGPGRAVLRPLPRRTGRGGAPVRRKAGARRHGGRRDPRLPPDRRQPAPRHRRHPQAGRAAP